MAATDLGNSEWRLTSYHDDSGMRQVSPQAEVTLTFQGGAAGGKSACNRYRCPVTIGDDTMAFGMGVSTKMACPPPLMEIEAAYLRLLDAVAAWQVADGTLELRDSAGTTLLVFARA